MTDGFVAQVFSTLLWSVMVHGDPTVVANVTRPPFIRIPYNHVVTAIEKAGPFCRIVIPARCSDLLWNRCGWTCKDGPGELTSLRETPHYFGSWLSHDCLPSCAFSRVLSEMKGWDHGQRSKDSEAHSQAGFGSCFSEIDRGASESFLLIKFIAA